MKRALGLGILVIAALGSSCSSGFPTQGARKKIILTRTAGDVGSPAMRLPIKFAAGPTITYHLEVQKPDGTLDDSFDGWVRMSAKPGTVLPLQRNVHLVGGVADAVPVTIVAAFGDTRVWAEDLGYTPAGPSRPDPACANGIDDDKDGTIDFPADPGCFAPDDDDETSGSLATGVSEPVFFTRPRIADVRGVAENGGTSTAFPREQVRMDTGYRPDTGTFDFDVVVTRISSDGFYVTDVQDQNARGFASVFAFTFSPPQKLAICDRLKSFNGTASDFFGFTEVGFPTWSVEYYDPDHPARPCLVPEPRVLAPNELAPATTNLTTLFRYESGLVRVQSGGVVDVHIGKHFGDKKVPLTAGVYVPADDASNCDLDSSGKVDFSKPAEAACSNACKADLECSEFTNFVSQSNFTLVVTSMAGIGKIQGNGSTSPDFDPVLLRGKKLGAFTGSLRYFSGGQQFTIEARCADDIVVDPMAQPLASDKACIRSRSDLDNNEGSR
jgi:hypothetical protein